MCGITGLVYNDRERKIDPVVLKKMTDSIHHRGPDDEGYFINENIGLGFRRLSIIDLSTGHQPLANHDNSITIIFNGEIYNYQEHRQNLIKKRYHFNTTTDTEVILHLYEEFGVDCLQYLRGMYAFAIWDENKKQLFCARDRFGIKPFYYYSDDEKFVFGSEIKTILKAGNINKSLSFDALDSYLSYGYITNDLSIYQNIKKLQPGHYLLLTFKAKITFEIKSYWDINFEPDYSKSARQWEEEIQATFSETVKLHMISDVPLGAFLSGGIDSSSVVAMMAKNSNLPIKTFSIGFKEQKFNELEFAAEVAKKYNCEHREQIVEPESINLLSKIVSAYDEPFSDSSAIPTYYVSKLAREYVTVVLSGDGGDELFAGYNSYSWFNKIHSFPFNFSSQFLNKNIWGTVHNLIPRHGKGKDFTYFLSKNRKFLFAYLNLWSKEQRKHLLLSNQPEINYAKGSEQFKEIILRKKCKNDFISKMQYLDMKTYMVDDILTKVDRASMLNSLEVRVPILDHVFAELSFKIPSGLKLRGNEQKYIFKAAMKPFLPKNILAHPKQGFGIPISLWFKDDLKTYIRDTFHSEHCLIYEYFDKKYVQKGIDKLFHEEKNSGLKIWSLLIFNEWLLQNK